MHARFSITENLLKILILEMNLHFQLNITIERRQMFEAGKPHENE